MNKDSKAAYAGHSTDSLNIFIVAGEPSGDVHAANLVKELRRHADIRIYGTGGAKLAQAGQKQFYTTQDLAAIGFVGAIRKIPFLLKAAKHLEAEIIKIKPDAIILVDYSGFNLRFAKKIKKHGIPVIALVAPQVWAWHYSRVKTLAAYFDKVLCILPFEEELLRKEGVNAVYIGHPVTDSLIVQSPDRNSFCEKYGLDPEGMIIGIAPGSRPKEIRSLVPVMGEAAKYYTEKNRTFQYVLAQADSVALDELASLLPPDVPVRTAGGDTPDIFRYSDLLWICSGTATLEAGILNTPMIILYAAGRLDLFIAKRLTRLRMVGMPNIILQYEAVPELLGERCTAEELIETTDKMLAGLEKYRERLAPLAGMFAGRTPMKSAAEEIIKTIRGA